MAQLKDLLVAGPARILGPLYTSGGITGNLTGNASTATTANKVANALTIQTNGTTAATFDGSAAKTVNITPANIGAAASSHTHSSYVNQNAFSNVVIGSTTVAADSATDTLTLVAGSNVTITPDATNDKITIAATNTWRGIQNNLTSDSTTDSLSAAQGKALKALIDGKADSSHTHSYLPLSGGTLTGQLTAPGFISSGTSYGFISSGAAYGLRVIGGSYGFMVRNDGSDTWFLFTDENNVWGDYNSLRPFRINNSTGLVYMLNGLRSSEGRTSGPHTTYSSYMWRNTSAGTSATPVADSTYGSSGAVYLQYS